MSTEHIAKVNGEFVTPGDYIRDSRGTEWIFCRVSRGTEYNGTAKIQVMYADSESEGYREFYHHVFPGLTVEAIDGDAEPTDEQLFRLLERPKHH